MAEQMTILEAAARAFVAAWQGDPDRSISPSAVRALLDHTNEGPALVAALTTLGLTPEQLQQPVGSLVVVPAWFTQQMEDMERRKAEHAQRVEERRASIRRGGRPAGPQFTLNPKPGAKEGGA